jgi:dsDNA-specific endonuclease/ATPase MutS2
VKYLLEDITGGLTKKEYGKKGDEVKVISEGTAFIVEHSITKVRFSVKENLLTNEQPPDQKKHAVPNRKR